jgi:uncharacterized protein (DUF58 family)
MRFPVDGEGKWEHACAIALGLTSVAIADGDAVGLTVVAREGDRVIPPRRRRDVLHDIAQLFGSIEPAGDVSISAAVGRAASEPRLVVITDFLGEAENALKALRVAAAAGSEIFAVHVAAHEELDPPARPFMAADPERPTFRRALSDDNRGAYLAAFGSWRDRVAAELHAMNANYLMTSTREAVHDAVRRIVGSSAR